MSQEREPQGAPEQGRSGLLHRWRSGGPSSFVYIVVGVVAFTLAILLAIIYFSASERERTSPPICTDISLAGAKQAVKQGEVESLTIVSDDTLYTPTSERYGPVLARLDYDGGGCSNLPQGIVNRDVVYTMAGLIAFYNQHTDEHQVEISWQQSDHLGEALFTVPTAVPSATETPAVVVIATATPTPSPAASPAPPAGTPVAGASPVASPSPVVEAIDSSTVTP